MGRLLPLLLFLLIVSSPAHANEEPAYYVWDGQTLTRVYSDPGGAEHVTWNIWLFRQGEPHIPRKQWGALFGNSAADVLKKLERAQSFETRYERWCRCDYGPSTHFNPSLPIAVTGRQDAPSVATTDLDVPFETLNGLHEAFNAAVELTSSDAPPSSGFGDFAAKLKEAHDKAAEIAALLQRTTGPALDGVATHIDTLSNALSGAAKQLHTYERRRAVSSRRWTESFDAEYEVDSSEQELEFISRGLVVYKRFGSGNEYETTVPFSRIAHATFSPSEGRIYVAGRHPDYLEVREVVDGEPEVRTRASVEIYSRSPEWLEAVFELICVHIDANRCDRGGTTK